MGVSSYNAEEGIILRDFFMANQQQTNILLTILIIVLLVLGLVFIINSPRDTQNDVPAAPTNGQQNEDGQNADTPDGTDADSGDDSGEGGVDDDGTDRLGGEVSGDGIVVTLPTIGQTMTSPFTVTGRAQGVWYFEGSFPVRLLSSSGALLAQGNAIAQGNWMTTDFVPFSLSLSFTIPSGVTSGTLVLANANPSGLPENARSVEVPVLFVEE